MPLPAADIPDWWYRAVWNAMVKRLHELGFKVDDRYPGHPHR